MADDPGAISGEYSAAQIKKTTWGKTSESAEGGWETVWKFEMDTSRIGDSSVQVHSDDELGFNARLYVVENGRANLVVRTVGHAMLAEYYPLTFTSFRLVNDNLGAIETIEGLPRDWYAPFRSRPHQIDNHE